MTFKRECISSACTFTCLGKHVVQEVPLKKLRWEGSGNHFDAIVTMFALF